MTDTKNFEDPTKRHSQPVIKQLGNYCYAEFIADDITYGVFGIIMNDYLIGEWYDVNDRIGYFGTFHLLIKDKKNMTGVNSCLVVNKPYLLYRTDFTLQFSEYFFE